MGVLAGRISTAKAAAVLASHGLTAAQIAERVRTSRHAQGLPERVTGALTLRDVANLLGGPVHSWSAKVRPAVA